MDIKLFKKILKEFENSSIYKLEVSENDFSVKMEKNTVPMNEVNVSDKLFFDKKSINQEKLEENVTLKSVESPLVGTFYDSPSPESSAFIKVDQHVNEGDILCIVEAMKVMNEIRSPFSGVVKKINVSNETMVEYGQVLVEIEVL